MKTIDTMLGFDSSNKAKLKLRCIELLEAHGWEAVSLAFPTVSRASVYRWRKRFNDSGRRPTSLVSHSTKPKRVRQMQVPSEILSFIKLMRKQYPKLSKYKLKPFLDEYCTDHGLPCYSVSWIGKVISRYNYFFNHGRQAVKRRTTKQKQKTRIKRCPKANKVKLGHLQLNQQTKAINPITTPSITKPNPTTQPPQNDFSDLYQRITVLENIPTVTPAHQTT